MPAYFENNQFFTLSNAWFSYVFRVTEEGLLQHVYYGKTLSHGHRAESSHKMVDRALTSVYEGIDRLNLNDLPTEYPFHGRSDYRYPAFQGRNADGNSIFSFKYKSYEVSSEKPSLDGLPSARSEDSETLTIFLEDTHLQLELQLYYTVYESHGVLARSSRLVNRSDQSVSIEGMASTTLHFSPADYELLHLYGGWAREFNVERLSVPSGRFTIDSSRGATSAAHYPFMAVMEKGAGEDHGQVYATTLVYSGNFSMSVEKNEFQDVRIVAGVNPFEFKWILRPGETFTTPEALHVYASNGLQEMSHIWHQFVRERITPERFAKMPRPSYLNTWEACYFDVTSEKVLALADKAVELGLDMIVLDDGWFVGRNDDTTSLGDWVADETKMPEGIPWLAAQVKAKGLKFGLWVEPEMVSPDSDLCRRHPEWVIQVPGRKASLGRYQLTLDLSQQVVVDHLYESLASILSCEDICYVKWDMNRAITEVGSTALAGEQQGEVAHRYILGLYQLLDRLTTKFPEIIFENCASGGNRCDLAMLSYMTQTWTSDMCDPIGRLDIINGASLLLPNEILAAYIGPSPNHQNGRVSSLKTRFLAGLFCAARGLSLNLNDLETDKEELKKYASLIKSTQNDFLGGKFYRLIKTDNEVCWQYTTADASKVYLTYFHILSSPNLPLKKVSLKGLDPKANYSVEGKDNLYPGDVLMHSGYPLPYVSMFQQASEAEFMDPGDFSSQMFVFRKKADSFS